MTAPTLPEDVATFVAGVTNARRRTDAEAALALVGEVTGEAPTMWGRSIVGYGSYHYRYATGREGNSPRVSLSPRSSALVFYGLQDAPASAAVLDRLGPHTLGAGCVNVKDLSAVDDGALRDLVRLAWEHER